MSSSQKAPFTTPIDLYRELRTLWSAETASPPESWTPSNPAKNHCSLTALIVHDYFGGAILRTRTVGGMHFYNLIDGTVWDLTVSQFPEPIPYEGLPSSRDQALQDTSPAKYQRIVDGLRARGF